MSCVISFLIWTFCSYRFSVGPSKICSGLFLDDCNLFDTPLCIVKIGMETNAPNLRFELGVRRELIRSFVFGTFSVMLFDHCIAFKICI